MLSLPAGTLIAAWERRAMERQQLARGLVRSMDVGMPWISMDFLAMVLIAW